MKFFMFFIKAFFWLWLFIISAGIFGFFAIWIYFKSSENLPFSIILGLFGIVNGVALAEYVRRKYGLDNFFGRLMATPDIDGSNILDEKPGNKKEIDKEHYSTQK